MKTRSSLRCLVAVLCIFVFAVETRGEAEATENLGLERWETFVTTLKQYRTLLNNGTNATEDTKREIDEYIEADSKAQMKSLRRFYSGRLMLFVTRTTKDTPGLPESELASMIGSGITELEMALWGAHKDLPSESTLSDKVDVMIHSAEEMKKIFNSWRIQGGTAPEPNESNKENKAEMATPRKPSD
ncbi:hypothetical protein [Luteolibacter sp. AS25]|uniref:hypothetical protein n=1 Tax=Luteolibacter sp. AS25 TaxID=3135776 RepID=UPI00398A7B1F